ncbi:PREDICTED: probable serine incorporator [Acropora digitifera]|uniref:probable serine incorporator n=1 Tax=Acropora digitifera TaxID=70779 RepID=UPI000779FF1F|nr:PREDICTED: probable serine incorporator [Acropora digitifera]
MLSTDIQQAMVEKVPFLNEACTAANCDVLVGYLAVYRICFGMAAFFFLFMVLNIGVSSGKDCRAGLNNGFWGLKFLLLLALWIAAFFIPRGPFGQAWMYIGFIGAFLFILIQLILLIDFAHTWNEIWVSNAGDGNKCWYFGLFFFMFVFYALALTGFILSYVFFTESSGCHLNKFFISFNFIMCLIISVISILPKVQEGDPSFVLNHPTIIIIIIEPIMCCSAAASRCNLFCEALRCTQTKVLHIKYTKHTQSPFCMCTEGTGVFLIDDHEVLLLSQRCAALSWFGISCIITQWFFYS